MSNTNIKVNTEVTLKSIAEHIDLYGSDVLLIALRNQYKSVAYTNKSIPSPGSPCRKSSEVANGLIISKVIFHRNNEVTIFTQHGNLKFF